ncbi:fructose-bisphosphate aldolase [Caldichromatium japonicum]|uniref:Fructose-bisphosphate aldolase n=1 Tax=Caldichromatium japonicum TaxID=2699430 RepID=A0A6G7VA37_9GAMM|nr:class II fructose-bisphosphate aldolase [Caldichromatium japonicum]QIK36718.1 fructose-bisphosphate aldolase [Caldichromatium japonicum]
MLVDAFALLEHARRHAYAIGAYDVIDTAMLEGVIQGAERVAAPVILSLAEAHLDLFDEAALMRAVVDLAQRTPLPVAIHYDHGSSLERLERATRLGYTSLMLDASHLVLEENVAATRAAAELAHRAGMPLEGELGYVPGEEGRDAELHPGEIRYTDPKEACDFVAATGCDWLAVSIGTVHGRFRGEPKLDFARLEAVRQAAGVPLVIHGGTGLSDEQFRVLVRSGTNKINYYTALVELAAQAAAGQRRWEAMRSAAVSAIAAEVARTSTLWGAAGQADSACRFAPPLVAVEHVIYHNWTGNEAELQEMQARGIEVLGQLPGVQRIHAGYAERQDAPYRYLWTMTLANPRAMQAFREDPRHQDYANAYFRPWAAERITIDFLHLSNPESL